MNRNRLILATESRADRAIRAQWEGSASRHYPAPTPSVMDHIPVSVAFAASLTLATFIATYLFA